MFTLVLLQVAPSIAPLVFAVFIWTILGSFLWALWSALREGWSNLRKLHQIPCSRCAFFTGDYHLKCTVHPCKALSEEAINCLDYESISTPRPYAPLCR